MKKSSLILKIVLFAALVFSSCSQNTEGFQSFLQGIDNSPAKDKQILLDAYVKKHTWPQVEGEKVYFLVKDSLHKNIYLSGDMNSWTADSVALQNITGTAYHFVEQTYPRNSRLEYKFVADSLWLRDLLNPIVTQNSPTENSVLMMPGYRFPTETLLIKENRTSSLDTLLFTRGNSGIPRELYIYRHPAADPNSPFIIFNDGPDYLRFGQARIILDNLIAGKRIPAVNAVFIEPLNRMKEYCMDDSYLFLIFKNILPKIKREFPQINTKTVGIGGVSLGGLISVYALKDYASEIDFVFSQSGSFWIEEQKILNELKDLKKPLRIYLDKGVFEKSQEPHINLAGLLTEKQIEHKYILHNEGHNWSNWRAHLSQALQYCLKESKK